MMGAAIENYIAGLNQMFPDEKHLSGNEAVLALVVPILARRIANEKLKPDAFSLNQLDIGLKGLLCTALIQIP
jgi:hypothetical protein